MTLPVQFKNRKALNPRLGIKSSFSGIRNAVALLYLIFNAERHQGRRTSTIYSEDNGSGGIMLKKELLDSIQTYLEDSRKVAHEYNGTNFDAIKLKLALVSKTMLSAVEKAEQIFGKFKN